MFHNTTNPSTEGFSKKLKTSLLLILRYADVMLVKLYEFGAKTISQSVD